MGLLGNNQINEEQHRDPSGFLNLLPFKYQSLRTHKDERPKGFQFYSNSITIEAQLDNKEIIVCGEAFDVATATAKAISELIERSVLLKQAASNPLINKTSNGWAAHFEEKQAKLNAVLEIIERDAVLAQWYSATPFLEIENTNLPSSILNWVNTELSKSEFPVLKVLISTKGIGPSVTCALMKPNGFGVCGHSSKADLLPAIENAIGEACRAAHMTLRNAHYADTEILKTNQFGTKINPGAHAVYYAYQEPLPDWMFGEKISWFNALHSWSLKMAPINEGQNLVFTTKTVMSEPVFVSYSKHPETFELTWGPQSSDEIRKTKAGHRLIGNEVNLKPHPIS